MSSTHQDERKDDAANKDPLCDFEWNLDGAVISTFIVNRGCPVVRGQHGHGREDINGIDGHGLQEKEVDPDISAASMSFSGSSLPDAGEPVCLMELASVDEVELYGQSNECFNFDLRNQEYGFVANH